MSDLIEKAYIIEHVHPTNKETVALFAVSWVCDCGLFLAQAATSLQHKVSGPRI